MQPSSDGDAMMKAVRRFLEAPDWAASQQVLEAQQQLLFDPQVETILEMTIQQAADPRIKQILQLHLHLIRQAKQVGIPAAFAQINEPDPLQEIMSAIQQWVSAEDEPARRQIFEAQATVLCRPEVAHIFLRAYLKIRQQDV